jgi:hypothetical protein
MADHSAQFTAFESAFYPTNVFTHTYTFHTAV